MTKPGALKPILFAFLPALLSACTPALHLLVRDGLVHDGTGASACRADIGIIGDSIAFMGDSRSLKLRARRVVDAGGYQAAPGFIDPHTHVDPDLLHPERKALLSHIYQGVTTLIVGNDGGGPVRPAWLMDSLERRGIGANVGFFVGHNSLRRAVMGMAHETPTEAQMEEMKALLARGMDDGALGLSAGLFYTPGSFATTEEVAGLAKVAARAGGIYDVHLRDESSYNMTEEDILAFMRQPWLMASSDGGAGHPRKYGSFPRKIKTYVLEKQALSLEEMICRSTLLTAQVFGIPRRGRLAPGFFAGLLVFRPEEVRDRADYDSPFEYAEGMRFVIINDKVAVEEGRHTGRMAGRVVQRAGVPDKSEP